MTDRGLQCPDCGCRDFRVVRTAHKPRAIQRLRQCRHCGRRMVTYERVAGSPPDPSGRPTLAEMREEPDND